MVAELIPFWSYGESVHRSQLVLNIIMFLPVGLLSGSWKSVGLAAGDSGLIELTQLLSLRGICEFDDVIHNTLGTAIGVFLVLLFQKLVGREKS